MKSEKQIEKEYSELQKQKEAKRKEKEKIKNEKLKKEFADFKKIFNEKYKGRCFYGIPNTSNYWDKMRLLGINDSNNNELSVYYKIKDFSKGYSNSADLSFSVIYKCGSKILYYNTYSVWYDSIKDFTKSISAIEKHQKVLSEMYVESKFDNIEKEMYEKTKDGYRFGSDTVAKFFDQFKHLRCEVDPKEFNQILEREIK